ncbi:MAG: tyrosinase family protein [Pseudomonadota bacterium]
MTVRIRRDVYALPSGDLTLDFYRRAIDILRQRPLGDPTSWWWIGSVHGQPGFTPPPGSTGFWDRCQHQTWYFLPWHRGYLAAMEATVAKVIRDDLGGPDDWALPYWNYSADLAANPDARNLPPAFRDQTMPDGTPNALFAPRAADAAGDVGLRDADVQLGALAEADFTPASDFDPGFGGPRTGFSHFGSANGALERVPHNVVHVRINGWMIDPNTAAFDPIFWLHHCNIDRLWEEWRAADPSHTNPADAAWRTDLSFQLHDADGQPFSFTCADMEDTTQVLGGYRYDTLPAPSTAVAGDIIPGEPEMADLGIVPELAGASDGPVQLSGATTRASVTMQTDGLGRSFTEAALPTPIRVYLRLEEVTGTGVPGDFDVMVDLDDDDQPPLTVGILTTFGIANASDPSADHGGAGLTQVYDITDAAERLNLTTETAQKVQVTFERVEQRAVTEAAFPEIEGLVTPARPGPTVQVGRIAIYFE